MRGQFVPVCYTLSLLGKGVLLDSADLYVVIITIKVAIYALYVDFYSFVFTCHRMAFIIMHEPPRR